MKRFIAACLIILMSIETTMTAAASQLYEEPVTILSTEDTGITTEEELAEEQPETEQTETEEDGQTEEMEQEVQGIDDIGLGLSSPSVILMEAVTGKVIYEHNSNERLYPASVTKIMTLLLIFDALAEGKTTLEDKVIVSEYAASMGGSQVFLEPGEEQTVDTMIKCIAVASANDACVAMAEHLYGTESEFVNMMNERAKGLGMENTAFENCNGLDSDNHLTTAADIALMSRELITKYPQVHDYSTIWMENITHTTRKGTTEFGLSNTNKLLKQYEYANGLKTGSTSLAKYCVSATAKKDDIELIAVVMAAPDYKVRFHDAEALLNYGFSKCNLYTDTNEDTLSDIKVSQGVKNKVGCAYEGSFQYVDVDNADLSTIEKTIEMKQQITAPVKAGDIAGKAVYKLNGNVIGTVNIRFTDDVDKATFTDYIKKAGNRLCL